MIGWVYILRSDIDVLYVGSTDNLRRRMRQHASGQVSTTKKFTSFKLVFSQKFSDIKVARETEGRIKNLKRRDYLEKIIKDGYIKLARKPSSFNG